MKKTGLNCALAFAMGTVTASVEATNIDVTQMIFSYDYPDEVLAAEGTLLDTLEGDPDYCYGCYGSVDSIDDFFYAPWNVVTIDYFDKGTTDTIWSGTSTISGVVSQFSYAINLLETQEAWATHWNWTGSSHDIPLLIIMDCKGSTTPGDTCVGTGTPMLNGPFPGEAPVFNGVVAVPVPAAIWLFGSGLMGLIGLAIRKKSG